MKLKQILQEVNPNGNILVINVGGTRYEISRSGSIKRLGSEPMKYGSTKMVGAETFYRKSGNPSVEISLKDIFADPNKFVGTFPVVKDDIGFKSFHGVRESDSKVIWAKFK